MKEHPIIFQFELVAKIIAKQKGQTRRPIKSPDWVDFENLSIIKKLRKYFGLTLYKDGRAQKRFTCPYGVPGDKLWVRETFVSYEGWGYDPTFYKADYVGIPTVRNGWHRWKPSIHMPRWASRITIPIKSIRVERLMDITEADAIAEGFLNKEVIPARTMFFNKWDDIYPDGHKFDLSANPWVWVIEWDVDEIEVKQCQTTN